MVVIPSAYNEYWVTRTKRPKPWWRDSTNRVSGDPGAIQ